LTREVAYVYLQRCSICTSIKIASWWMCSVVCMQILYKALFIQEIFT